MMFMLDTNVCVVLINRRPGYEQLLDRIAKYEYGDLLISAITVAELEFGVAKSARGAENRGRLDIFLARFEIAPFGQRAAVAYGPLRAALEANGTPIGPLDTQIAAHGLAIGATVVTDNTGEFSRVAGLKVENWLAVRGGK